MKVKEVAKFVLIVFIIVSSAYCYATEAVESDVSAVQNVDDLNWLEQYDVVWTTQSKNSGESMPVSGGVIGLNVWVENDELLIYMGRSGYRDENGALLKPGRRRYAVSRRLFPQRISRASFQNSRWAGHTCGNA